MLLCVPDRTTPIWDHLMLVYDYRYNYWHAKGEDPLMLYIPCNYSQVDWLMDWVSSPYAQWLPPSSLMKLDNENY